MKKTLKKIISSAMVFAMTAVLCATPAMAATSDTFTGSSIGGVGRNNIACTINGTDGPFKDSVKATIDSEQYVPYYVGVLIMNKNGIIDNEQASEGVSSSKISVTATALNNDASGGAGEYRTTSNDWGNFTHNLFCAFN